MLSSGHFFSALRKNSTSLALASSASIPRAFTRFIISLAVPSLPSACDPIAVFSNNAEIYVRAASDAQGVTPLFVQFLCQKSIHLHSKPNVGAYSTALEITEFTQDSHTVFLDDKSLHRVAPKELGLTTIHIGERAARAGFVESIDFTFPTFKDFLRQLRRQDETTVMLT